LLLAFIKSFPEKQLDELFVVLLRNRLLFAIFTKLYFLSIHENGCKSLINSLLEVNIIELFGVLAQVLYHLPAVSIKSFDVIFAELFFSQLLPEDGS
jgi:hypothetical protein